MGHAVLRRHVDGAVHGGVLCGGSDRHLTCLAGQFGKQELAVGRTAFDPGKPGSVAQKRARLAPKHRYNPRVPRLPWFVSGVGKEPPIRRKFRAASLIQIVVRELGRLPIGEKFHVDLS